MNQVGTQVLFDEKKPRVENLVTLSLLVKSCSPIYCLTRLKIYL
jgi:hypothetical protein